MENASKALIIAGAILISILLITLGLVAYNQAKGAATKSQGTTNELSSGIDSGTTFINNTLNTIYTY